MNLRPRQDPIRLSEPPAPPRGPSGVSPAPPIRHEVTVRFESDDTAAIEALTRRLLEVTRERDAANAKAAEYCRLYQSATGLTPSDPESLGCSCSSSTVVRIHDLGTYCGDAQCERVVGLINSAYHDETGRDIADGSWLAGLGTRILQGLPGVPSGGDPGHG